MHTAILTGVLSDTLSISLMSGLPVSVGSRHVVILTC
jgi:hypothetical protein